MLSSNAEIMCSDKGNRLPYSMALVIRVTGLLSPNCNYLSRKNLFFLFFDVRDAQPPGNPWKLKVGMPCKILILCGKFWL